MGVDTLQQFVENEYPDCVLEVDFKSTKFDDAVNESNSSAKNQRRPQVLVVHADSCLRYLYPQHYDWICGGQWSELLNNVERFVRSFRQANVELVVFFEGCLGQTQIHDWRQEQTASRELIRKVNNQVSQRHFFQSRKDFISPACLKTVLRLAFRACSVIVCSSIEDVHEEIITYSYLHHCLGILGQHPAYLLYNFPNYFSSSKLRTTKRSVTTVKYEFEKVLQKLGLSEDKLPLFASLLGNGFLPEGYLASFHWKLLDADHPMQKLQMEGSLKYQNILPPADVVIQGVAKFLNDKTEDDLEAIVSEVFKEAGYNMKEAIKRFTSSVHYYKKGLAIAKGNHIQNQDEKKENGYPTHTFDKNIETTGHKGGNQEHSYQERWKQFQQINVKPIVFTNKDKESEKPDETEASLELAAKALDKIEIAPNRTENEGTDGLPSDVIVLQEEKPKVQQAQWDQLSTQQHLQGLHGVTIGIAHDEKPAPADDSLPVTLNGHQDSSKDTTNDVTKLSSEDSCETFTPQRESSIPAAAEEILKVAKQRHQNGQMCPDIYKLLVKGEILLSIVLEDENIKHRPATPLLFRPVRQLIYGILFDQKSKHGKKENDDNKSLENNKTAVVKEWIAYGNNNLLTPELVEGVSMKWEIPPLKTLWFGRQPEDNNNRMKAFLTCFKSDTKNMTNTRLVPQRFLLLCCVLRYLIQQENNKSLISQHDIDAFLAQALSPHLSIEQNSMNLANLKLNKIDSRPMQLAALFMSGIECAVLANDACGSPVPWEFCCPWTFFDGKLFHSKWLQTSLSLPLIDICDGKTANLETLERLRWVITEGLNEKYVISGHTPGKSMYTGSPFGPPPASLMPAPVASRNGRHMGALSTDHGGRGRGRGRGYPSKRPVPNTGGTLQVAGMPVAHWVGNKGGMGKKEGPDIVVGGLSSVDLPSSHRGRRGCGRGRPANRGRGLLPTPIVQPWALELDLPPTSIPIGQPMMRGGGNISIGKPKLSSARMNTRTRGTSRPSGKPGSANAVGKSTTPQAGAQPPKLLTKSGDCWVGKGRGLNVANGPQSNETLATGPTNIGRGQWQE